MNVCARCGAQNQPTNKFCLSCGAPVQQSPGASPAAAPQPAPPAQHSPGGYGAPQPQPWGNLRPSPATTLVGATARSSTPRSRAGGRTTRSAACAAAVGGSSRPPPRLGPPPPLGAAAGASAVAVRSEPATQGGPPPAQPAAVSRTAVPQCASRACWQQTWVSPPRRRRRTTTRPLTQRSRSTRACPCAGTRSAHPPHSAASSAGRSRKATHLAIRNIWTRMRRAHSLASRELRGQRAGVFFPIHQGRTCRSQGRRCGLNIEIDTAPRRRGMQTCSRRHAPGVSR